MYQLPFMVVGAAMVFVVTLQVLSGPLKPLVPRCGPAAYIFCLKAAGGAS